MSQCCRSQAIWKLCTDKLIEGGVYSRSSGTILFAGRYRRRAWVRTQTKPLFRFPPETVNRARAQERTQGGRSGVPASGRRVRTRTLTLRSEGGLDVDSKATFAFPPPRASQLRENPVAGLCEDIGQFTTDVCVVTAPVFDLRGSLVGGRTMTVRGYRLRRGPVGRDPCRDAIHVFRLDNGRISRFDIRQ